jgi:hypothetical protein
MKGVVKMWLFFRGSPVGTLVSPANNYGFFSEALVGSDGPLSPVGGMTSSSITGASSLI